MFQRIRNSRAAETGFTLVEMVVVVAVIGIIASVAVLAIGGTTKSSKTAACKADLATVQTASDSYAASNDGDYIVPGTGEDVAEALVTAGSLRKAPESGTYSIAANGNVTVSPACPA